MTKRSRRLLLFAAVAGLGALAVAAWMLARPTAITRENADRIRAGMTLSEVEAILGGPARDERTGPCVVDCEDLDEPALLALKLHRSIDLKASFHAFVWLSDAAELFVGFDGDGRVTRCSRYAMRRQEESLPDMLRRWLRL